VLIAIWNEAGEHMRRHLDRLTLAEVAGMAKGNAPWPGAPSTREPTAAPV
jgi:Rrf2 family iron-sulfur cluster assembly transcriptional regulator